MTVPVKRVPPPPPIAQDDPVFNHWLHDLTAFLAEGGGIDPGTIPGYDTLLSTVALHTTQIASLIVNVAANTSAIAANTSAIATNTANITANTTDIATNTADIIALNIRSQVYYGTVAPTAAIGVNGDWYSDTVAKHIYVKSSGSWTLIV